MSDFLHNLPAKLRLPWPHAGAARAERKAALLEETTTERVATDNALHQLAPISAPADMQLRLRLAVSHEQVRAQRRLTGRIAHRWHLLLDNTLRAFAVQGAVAAFGVLLLAGVAVRLGAVTPGQAVEANDIPLIGFSSPHFLYATAGLHSPVVSASQAPVTVEARVNSQGRVYDYRVLSGALDEAGSRALRERMWSSVFQPARILGEPVRGSVVLTFADIKVHG